MKTRLAKRLGTPVSEIGLGCWQLGAADWGDVSESAAMEILQAAVDHGVTFIDTADVYGAGRSEALIGKFLKRLGEKSKGLFVASKLGRLKGFPDQYTEALLRESTKESVLAL